jgi:hypothetical protein
MACDLFNNLLHNSNEGLEGLTERSAKYACKYQSD